MTYTWWMFGECGSYVIGEFGWIVWEGHPKAFTINIYKIVCLFIQVNEEISLYYKILWHVISFKHRTSSKSVYTTVAWCFTVEQCPDVHEKDDHFCGQFPRRAALLLSGKSIRSKK